MILNVIRRGPDQAEDAARNRPPIVLLHGLFGRARNLGFFQRRLATHRRTLASQGWSRELSPWTTD